MIKSIARICIIFSLVTASLTGFMANPPDNSEVWGAIFYVSKITGFGAAYIAYRLYDRWCKTDRIISAYDRWCTEGI